MEEHAYLSSSFSQFALHIYSVLKLSLVVMESRGMLVAAAAATILVTIQQLSFAGKLHHFPISVDS